MGLTKFYEAITLIWGTVLVLCTIQSIKEGNDLEGWIIYSIIFVFPVLFGISWHVFKNNFKRAPLYSKAQIKEVLRTLDYFLEKYPDYFEGFDCENDDHAANKATDFMILCMTLPREEVEKIINRH